MVDKKTYIINGFVYDTPRLAYEDLEPPVSLSTFILRLKENATYEELMAPTTNKARYDRSEIFIFNQQYQTLRQAFNILKPDIMYDTFLQRYVSGLRDDDLVAPRWSNTDRTKTVKIDNAEYRSIRSAYYAIKPMMSIASFSKILNQYPDTTLDFINQQHAYHLIIDKVMYQNIRDAYQKIKPPMTFKDFRHGIHQAEDKYNIKMDDLLQHVKTIEINHKRYKSIQDAYVALKPRITLKTFTKRFNNGESYARLMGKDKKRIKINGKLYSSYRQAHRELCPDMSFSTFRYKLEHDKNFLTYKKMETK